MKTYKALIKCETKFDVLVEASNPDDVEDYIRELFTTRPEVIKFIDIREVKE